MGDNNTKWERVEAADIKRGDEIRATHPNGSALIGEATHSTGTTQSVLLALPDGSNSRNVFYVNGWSFERAVPERTLPTEDGVYSAADDPTNAPLYMQIRGTWQTDCLGTEWKYCAASDLPDDLVRLVPVTEVEDLRERIEKAKKRLIKMHRNAYISTRELEDFTRLLDGEIRS